MINAWWRENPKESLWLEVTDREDIGKSLNAPEYDDSGRTNWRYSLITYTRPGDIVLHYQKRAEPASIVGWSVVDGPPEPCPIVWAARGTYARSKGTVAHSRPGFRVPLREFTPLFPPVTLAQLRASQSRIAEIVGVYGGTRRTPRYFPFELSPRRDLRLLQGYMFKLPRAILDLFPALAPVQASVGRYEPRSPTTVFERAVRMSDGLVAPEFVATFSEAEALVETLKRKLFGGPAEATEGAVQLKLKRLRQRSRALVNRKKREVFAKTGRLACEVCGFDFSEVYGSRGVGFIEVHHTRPLHELLTQALTRTDDLCVVCANCHRMLHVKPESAVNELRRLVGHGT